MKCLGNPTDATLTIETEDGLVDLTYVRKGST